jgi:hypothetical protein
VRAVSWGVLMKFPQYNYITKEWWVNGKWYPDYPKEVIDGYYDYELRHHEGKEEDKKCDQNS